AILEAVDAGVVQGMKDLGGGGNTCGLFQMGFQGGRGFGIDLDKGIVPEPKMNSSENLISAYQKRILITLKSTDEKKRTKILDRWEVPCSRIGKVTSDGLLNIRHENTTVASAPARLVAEAPLEPHEATRPLYIDELAGTENPAEPKDLKKTFLDLLRDP